MLAADRDALYCDLAEQYHLLEPERLGPARLAVLACGLREPTRIRRAMGGSKADEQTQLLLAMLDQLRLLTWMQSRDAQHGRNRPPSLLRQALEQPQQRRIETFEDGAAFMAARNRITERG